ncbi:MAG: phosphodiesterase [Acidimicrobiales bacterium]|nr:phosphodiesterase [Acidimicrobiales bacterium]
MPRFPRSPRSRLAAAAAVASTGLLASSLALSGAPAAGAHADHANHEPAAQHVLLLSVDGLHQSDLAWYVGHHPQSHLAGLVDHGVTYRNALTPVPSDSFPGMVAQVTGGNPKTTGVYYDDSYNRALLPAGTTSCAGVKPGAEVTYFEAADKNPHALDAGQGLSGLPNSILNMTGNPRTVIDPAQLPVDAHTCKPVYPHSYLHVNTTFEVLRAAGMRTAWSDKHPAYDILQGPSGAGIQDLFTPEINSDAPTTGSSIDWTKDNGLTQQYDHYKVQAVINEIHGFDHSGKVQHGTPALFGMNFQSVSTGQKLPSSGGKVGGYLADGTPGPVLQSALDFVDHELGALQAALRDRHLDRSTAIILSAKHGQSPQEPSALTRVPDGPIIDGLNAKWATSHPGAAPLVATAVNDDAMIMWLSDHSAAASAFAKQYLLGHDGVGNDINGAPKAYTASGLAKVYAGSEAVAFFGTTANDPRVPDLYAIVKHGVVFTGGHGKIAEHGGASLQDRNVALVVSGLPLPKSEDRRAREDGHQGRVVLDQVETTQIAPTTLRLLGLDPQLLQAVRIEHTASLPGLGEG